MILEPSFGKGNRDSKSPSLQERHRDSKKLFKGALGFPNLLHELRLNELRHFPCHFHLFLENITMRTSISHH